MFWIDEYMLAIGIMLAAAGCGDKASKPAWPPPVTPQLAVLANSTNKTQSVEHAFTFHYGGMTGINEYGGVGMPSDEQDVKRFYAGYGVTPENSKFKYEPFHLEIEFTSTLGATQVTATARTWTKLHDDTGTNAMGWGAILTSGLVIVEKSALAKPDIKVSFPNSYAVTESSDNYCLLRLSESDNSKLLLVHSVGEGGKSNFRLALASVGSRIVLGESVCQSKTNGWYLDGKLVRQ